MSFNFTLKNRFFNITIRDKFILVFHDWFPMKFVFTYNISLVCSEINSKQKKIKSLFSKNYKPMRVWWWLHNKYTDNYCGLRLFSRFIQTQKRYPTFLDKTCILTLKTTCHIKVKLFLWTKLLENLLLAKSVAVPLSKIY